MREIATAVGLGVQPAAMEYDVVDQIAANSTIAVETRSEVVGLHGATELEAVDVRDAATGRKSRRDLTEVFVMIGADAVTDWLPPSVARDVNGFVRTGPDVAPEWTLDRRPFALETSVPGIFAVGDVRSGSVKRVAAGVGEGGMVIAHAHQYLALGR